MIVNRKIVLDYDETNEALGVAGREARVTVPGYGGVVRSGVVAVRPLAPGYGISTVTARIVRSPNS